MALPGAERRSGPAASTSRTARPTSTTSLAALEGRRLDGLRVVVDAANGAASARRRRRCCGTPAPTSSSSTTEPDGRNINAGCGATDTGVARRRGRRSAAPTSGWPSTATPTASSPSTTPARSSTATTSSPSAPSTCATAALLRDDTVVVTVMTNLGFRLAMEAAGIHVVETAVGDRYVLEALTAGGFSLGGEQSGHVIFRDLATTGDGLLTGLVLCDAVVRLRAPARRPRRGGDDPPAAGPRQRARRRRRCPTPPSAFADEIAAVEAELGDHGRVLVRPSGTEPLVRVMVEAPTQDAGRRRRRPPRRPSSAPHGLTAG